MKGLTKRQSEILQFIQEYINTHQYSPSYREIMAHYKFSSLGSVYNHIKLLKQKGFLSAEKQSRRSLFPISQHSSSHRAEIELPFIGYISVGNPIEMLPQSQKVGVPEFLVQAAENTYVLRARGDSLNEELIADGDLLLVETRHEIHDGETIIGNATLSGTLVRKCYLDAPYVCLASHTPKIPPIILPREELEIQGVLVGLIRSFFV